VKVLIVDDDDDIREAVTLVLQSRGYEVVQARDGLEGLRVLERDTEVSLVLLDLMMPRVDGIQFMRQVSANHNRSRPRVVVLSGHHAAQEKSSEIGADECLVKPVDVERLLATVRNHTEKR
jgi:DNA-binding response OmpR family regulator